MSDYQEVYYGEYRFHIFKDGSVDIVNCRGGLVDGGFVDEAAALSYLQEYLGE